MPVLITSCTNRKKASISSGLSAASLCRATVDELAAEWVRRLRTAEPLLPAVEMYCGRGFSEARNASKKLDGELWVVSAGLGLVPAAQHIPSYGLTLAKGSSDDITAICTSDKLRPAMWWDALSKALGEPAPVAKLVRSLPNELFVLCASEAYALMLQNDLKSLPDTLLGNVRIIGPRHPARLHPRLQHLVMPYDDRLDGPNSSSRGTRADYPQRAARHFATHVIAALEGADAWVHADKVRSLLAPLSYPVTTKRECRTDEELVQLIVSHWVAASGQSGRMLRHLRDELGVACEQGRFKKLFARARDLVMA